VVLRSLVLIGPIPLTVFDNHLEIGSAGIAGVLNSKFEASSERRQKLIPPLFEFAVDYLMELVNSGMTVETKFHSIDARIIR
jgi:hypothetical protein